MSTSHPVVDFHGHWFPPSVVQLDGSDALPAVVRDAWPLLTDVGAQLEAAEAAGTDIRVVNAVLSSIAPLSTVPFAELPARTNDTLAEAVREHGPRLAALATVDPYRGDEGAEEARRAVEELGLPGIVVDAAQGERLLTAPEARPTLAYAASAGVPVFAHPVNPPILPLRYVSQRHAGVLLARAGESALSTLSLLSAGTLGELDGLEIVLAGIGGVALLLGGFLPEQAAAARGRLHIDTMGFDPAVVRFFVDVVGPGHVLVGSDWPIIDRDASRDRVAALLDAIGAEGADRERIAGGNALALLGHAPVVPLA
jgi:predicted TIM-barrel fold metal-dependent hydrolase